MNLIKKISSLFIIALLMGSCADEPLPFEVYDDLEKGAFARILENNGANYFLTDIPGSVYEFTVEFYDENDGNNVASFDWTVRHRDNVNGGATTTPVTMQSVAASAFGRDATSGLPTATYSFSLADALSAMGLTENDVNGGDDIIFDGTIVMNDGRTFGPDNSGPAIQGGAGFDGFFRLVRPLLCVSELAGTYDVSTESTETGPLSGWTSGNVATGTVRFDQTDDGEYDIYYSAEGTNVEFLDLSFGTYFAGYGYDATDTSNQGNLPNGNVKVVDACNNLSFKGTSQWSEAYAFNSITVNGAVLTIDWVNDFGEGGITTITRTDGTDWPPLK
ncbi:MAG: hypothetical protein AAF985_05895 [Bacteroidota bacterium]